MQDGIHEVNPFRAAGAFRQTITAICRFTSLQDRSGKGLYAEQFWPCALHFFQGRDAGISMANSGFEVDVALLAACFDRCQHIGAVVLQSRRPLGPCLHDLAGRVDQERLAHGESSDWAEALHRHAIGIHNFMIGVGQQLECQAFLRRRKLLWLPAVSRLTPSTTALAALNFSRSRWKLCASTVQPESDPWDRSRARPTCPCTRTG